MSVYHLKCILLVSDYVVMAVLIIISY